MFDTSNGWLRGSAGNNMSETSNGWHRGSAGNMSETSNGWLRGSAGSICLRHQMDGLEAVQVTYVSYIQWMA